MWDPMPICILQEKHIYHLFFIFFECIPFNTQSSIYTTIHKEQNVGIQSQCFDMQCLFYFVIFKCLHFPLFISRNFITRTCPLDKKNTCFITQIIHMILDHLFVTKRSFFYIPLFFHIHIRKVNLPSTSKTY